MKRTNLSPEERERRRLTYERRKAVEVAEVAARVMGEPLVPGTIRPPLPLPVPTTARPGTPEKVLVIERRKALKQQLWHPDDCTGDTDGFAAFLSSLTSNGGNRTHRSGVS